jgi:hypothetical protein
MKTTTFSAILILLLFSACKKDTAIRQTHYTIIPQNNSAVNGTVTFTEQSSTSQTQVDIEVANAYSSSYVAHIHVGTPASYHIAVYEFNPIPASGGHISYKQNIALQYDSALAFNGTFVLHDSTGNNVLGLCGIGINK